VEILLLLAVLGSVVYHRRRGKFHKTALAWRVNLNRSTFLLPLALLVAAALSYAISIKLTSINPWGYWDAWDRINVKARFLFAGGDRWLWIFESTRIAHHDYPLLLPCTVARTWAWMGGISLLGPQVLSIVWGLWSLVSLFSVMAWLRGLLTAIISSLAYLTFTPLLLWSAAQYADIPLACYMVLCCAMLAAAEKFQEEGRRFWFFAGFFAGSAAWCKNEGTAFLLLVILWWLVLWVRARVIRRPVTAGSFLAGVGLTGSAVMILKLAYAGRSNLITDFSSSTQPVSALLVEGGRHWTILEHLTTRLDSFWSGWPLLLLAAAWLLKGLGRRQRVTHVGTLACAASLCAVYYLVLVTTPYDLDWQLVTALDRLILQLWPLFLLGLGVLFDERETKAAAES
jgi:hypothetical protein